MGDMEKVRFLQDWVENQMIRGRYIFTKEDVLKIGLSISNQEIKNNLSRLVKAGVIMSPWQNFYVIIPTEYKLKGVVPPSFYIDSLMDFLGRNYYVSLLSAAEFNGASHQRSMVFQIMCDGGSIRSGVKNGVRLEISRCNNLPLDYVIKLKTQMGTMNVSGPELTALDCVAHEQKVGGMSRAAEIITELCENLSWGEDKLKLLDFFTSATIQRLGYIIELLGEESLADNLYELLVKSGKQIRKVPLKQSVATPADMKPVGRWKIIENYKMEIDEL